MKKINLLLTILLVGCNGNKSDCFKGASGNLKNTERYRNVIEMAKSQIPTMNYHNGRGILFDKEYIKSAILDNAVFFPTTVLNIY